MIKMYEPKPEDAFPLDYLLTTVEANLFTVPTRKHERCIYVLMLSDTSGGANEAQLLLYDDSDPADLITTIRIPLIMNDTLPLVNPMNSPVLKIRAGWSLKGMCDVNNVQAHLMVYDL